jgi:sugar lactone lactonase YvrE
MPVQVLVSDLGIPESPRWHEGRLWFCNWIERQVVAVDMDGKAEVMVTRDPGQLPDGVFHRLAAHERFRNLKYTATNTRTIPIFTASRSQK